MEPSGRCDPKSCRSSYSNGLRKNRETHRIPAHLDGGGTVNRYAIFQMPRWHTRSALRVLQ